jgi:hypothetical protein
MSGWGNIARAYGRKATTHDTLLEALEQHALEYEPELRAKAFRNGCRARTDPQAVRERGPNHIELVIADGEGSRPDPGNEPAGSAPTTGTSTLPGHAKRALRPEHGTQRGLGGSRKGIWPGAQEHQEHLQRMEESYQLICPNKLKLGIPTTTPPKVGIFCM